MHSASNAGRRWGNDAKNSTNTDEEEATYLLNSSKLLRLLDRTDSGTGCDQAHMKKLRSTTDCAEAPFLLAGAYAIAARPFARHGGYAGLAGFFGFVADNMIGVAATF